MNNRPFIYKTDRPEYKFGYLEWKPEVEKPPFGNYCSTTPEKSVAAHDYKIKYAEYESDQKLIDQSRVPVSEELKTILFDEDHWIHEVEDLIEGKHFTLSGGVAVPVKEHSLSQIQEANDLIEEKDSELSRLQSENEKYKALTTKIIERIESKEITTFTEKDILNWCKTLNKTQV